MLLNSAGLLGAKHTKLVSKAQSAFVAVQVSLSVAQKGAGGGWGTSVIASITKKIVFLDSRISIPDSDE